ncbi:transcription factor MYB124-like [Rutidosis leptorrhynchoides]|uniref:transcription factor MYB124-like n=1 Tax=Rutidosis leptorrhynchoides TaxID=125765 RepID=UPI003A995ED1
MKKKACDSGNSSDNVGGDLKQKERHIVSWTKEEDDILREQIGVHGTNNWAIIASKFEDKSTRQCRRRWCTYLNSNYKRGGWSPEEDTLLCEAQKKFGNRWTEIAKVVTGRTDNAVKNRFSVICKRRAQDEALNKENSSVDVNTNNKRVMLNNRNNKFENGETLVHPMKTRKHIASTPDDCNLDEGLVKESINTDQQLRRPPLTVLLQKSHKTGTSAAQVHANTNKAPVDETCLKKEDPKIVATAQDDQCDVKPVLSEPIHTSSLKLMDDINIGECDAATNQDILSSCYKFKNDVGGVCPLPNSEFNSPIQVTPLFRSMAQRIPSPQFSESEKSFLLKTLGIKSTTGTSQSPSCKKALLHCL